MSALLQIAAGAPAVCPCCGQAFFNRPRPADVVASISLRTSRRRIADALVARFGQWVTREQLLHALYWDDADGGPAAARNCLAVCVHHLRRDLIPHGLTIEGRATWGGGRRMVWL